MYYYIQDENNAIVLFDIEKEKLENTLEFMPQYADLEIQETEREIVPLDNVFVFKDEYQEEIKQKEKERIGNLELTAADVERAIYEAKGMDFEDVVRYVENLKIDSLDVKRLKIELKANNFVRKHPYIDDIGKLLGFSPEDMDTLFLTKSLIKKEK